MIITFIETIRSEDNDHLLVYIFDNYYKQMKKQANLILKNEADADEAAQEVLISISQRMSFFETIPRERLAPILSICTKNKAIDLLRKNNRSPRIVSYHDLSEADNPELQDHDTPDVMIISNENIECAYNLMNSLDELSRDLLLLSIFYNMKNSAISEFLDMDRATVNTYLLRAKAKLRKKLNENK